VGRQPAPGAIGTPGQFYRILGNQLGGVVTIDMLAIGIPEEFYRTKALSTGLPPSEGSLPLLLYKVIGVHPKSA